MFCIYCGTYLERDVSVCPYCRESLREALDDIEFYNKKEIKKMCPDINSVVCVEFMGHTYSFDLQYSRIINSYLFFEKILYRNKGEFVKNMATIQRFDEFYVEDLISLAMKDLGKTALLTEALLNKEGIRIKYDTICAKYKGFLEKQFEEVKDALTAVREDRVREHQEIANQYRNKMGNNYETRWVGGGFGVKGTIKGGIQASLMNAGVSAMTGVISTAGFISSIAASNIQDMRKKSRLFNSDAFRVYIAEKYAYAMQDILIWNCKNIDNELVSSLFGGALYKRAETQSRVLTQEAPKEIKLQQFCDILLMNPYYINNYLYLYQNLEEITSKDLTELVSGIGNEINVKYLLMQADEKLIKESTSFLDDTKQTSTDKFHKLQKLSEKNQAYCDYELASAKIACMFKDRYVRNWFQSAGMEIRKTVGYYDERAVFPVRWDDAEHNAAYVYTLYNVYLKAAARENYCASSEKKLLIENSRLLEQIKCGNKAAICIWAAMYAEYSIVHKKNASKYTEIVWNLANQQNALAMSLIGEWFDQGTTDYPKNEYIAEMYFRMAMLQGNPYAIAYIGYYYMLGKAGYPRDDNFAGELLNLADEVPFSRSKRGK